MSGYASNNKYSLLGGLRAAAQSISYEIPLALSVLAIVLMTNSLSTVDIVNQQSGAGILSWNIWRQPVGFIVFWVCALAECERLPFDLPEDEATLVAGFFTEYSSISFGLFFLAEYANMIMMSSLTVILFLGGWYPPIDIFPLNVIPGIIWFVLKVFLILFVFLWVRATFPRYRYDQLMRLGWKIFLPLTLVWVVLTSAFLFYFEMLPK